MNSEQAGILLADKAKGWTSHDVAACIRGALKIKTGHSGTLDPMATGLLVILLGRATKLQNNYQKMPKSYTAEITLGIETDTWDAEGETVKEMPVPPLNLDNITAAAKELTGAISHPVPYYSAKKVGGVAMYKAAREGENIAKESTVEVFKWENIKLENNKITCDIHCGSGTYIRSLAYVLGRKLGTAAHISALRRTSIGGFDVKDAAGIEDIKKMPREEILKCVKIL